MTNRADADFLQVLLRQAREDLFVYLVLAERSLILAKAKAPQPNHHIHDDDPLASLCETKAPENALS
jgi:hypothetical protein